ncbi:S8 family peptidase [Arcobacter sp. YIC-310]|uniref:S8 family peptidase n=1 Tax=Arcobacter sp. YIC-310 TaxID=3376632 RepID=UPI003C1C14D4
MKIFLVYFLFIPFLFAKEFCIINFNKKVCDDFKISNGLIIKSKLLKNELKNKLKLNELKQIAFLKNSNVYLVDTPSPLEDYERFKHYDFIEYIIPDIIQSKKRAGFDIKKYQKDLNLRNYWAKNKGEGINIAIIDDGFDLSSEEFSDTNVIFSYDVDNKTLDASPKLKYDTHGTKVAGIIFAKHNGNNVEGIAPKANFIAIRQTTNKISDIILAFSVAQKAGAKIINCSWNSPFLVEIVRDVIKDIITKDVAIVFAAGNDSLELKSLSIEASIPEVVTVGARQKFSNYGKYVDFILDSSVMSIDKNKNLVMFGGTSASAPIISGLIALNLAFEPEKSIDKVISELKKNLKINQSKLD